MNAFLKFLSENKVWWLTPLVIVLLLVGYLVLANPDGYPAVEDTPFNYDTH